MYEELLSYIGKVENTYLHQLLEYYFVKDEAFIKTFQKSLSSKECASWICGRTFGAYIEYLENV